MGRSGIEHLAEQAIPLFVQMPRALWTWEVDTEVADPSSTERLPRVGLQPPLPGNAKRPPLQQVGEQLTR